MDMKQSALESLMPVEKHSMMYKTPSSMHFVKDAIEVDEICDFLTQKNFYSSVLLKKSFHEN